MQCERKYLTALSVSDASGRTTLHHAAACNGVMVGFLLSFRANRFRDATTYDGAHPIKPLFPKQGWVSPVSGQLWVPGDKLTEDDDGITPPSGYVSVDELLKARQETTFIDAKCSNLGTPLHYATVAGDARAIRSLLEFSAETFAVTKQGATPLELSSSRVVRRTLVPVENAVQLSVGLPMQRPGVKAPLIPSSTNVGFSRTAPGAPTDSGIDGASTVAARRSAAESALTYIVGSGEDVNGRTGIKLRSSLHIASIEGAIDIVQLLLANGARVDVPDVNGCTAMHLASELGTEKHMAVVKLLFDAGADVNAVNCLQKSPLHLTAVGGPHFEIGHNILPKAGSSSNQSEEENSDYDGIVAHTSGPGGTNDGNHAMICLLHDLGANLEAADLEGNTPLIAAARRGNHLGVKTLLDRGSRVYAQNIRGHTCLHVAAFAKQLPCVHLLTRWDAEVGKLKYVLDSSGRSSYDVAADIPTREALHTLWECSASGRLDLVQSVNRQTSLLPPGASAPWLPVRLWEKTRILERTLLHCVVTGAAKAMAMLRKEIAVADAAGSRGLAAKAAALGGGVGHIGTQDALARAAEQRRERERAPDQLKGTGLPPYKLSPSAVHTVSGIGLRFITDADNSAISGVGGKMPAAEYRAWGGHHADVLLTFPEPLDALAVRQTVDSHAFVPKPNVHLIFITKKMREEATRSEMAKERLKNGTELTASPTEKDFGRILDFLLRTGVDMADVGDIDGVTPLMLAAKYGLLFIMRRLLTPKDGVFAGSDVSLVDTCGNTALHYAYAFNQEAAASMIVEFSSDDGGGSTLDHIPNTAGKSPKEVAGAGLSIVPTSSEKLLRVERRPLPSSGLPIS